MLPMFEHQLFWLMLIFVRVSVIIMIGPFFVLKGIPKPVKVAFAIMLSIAILPKVEVLDISMKFQFLSFIVAIMQELFIGVIIGLASNFLFAGIQMAGHIIGLDMGFAMATFFDPSTNSNLPLLSRFLYYITFLIYLIIDGHHYVIGAIYYSYEIVPYSQWAFSEISIQILIKIVGDIFIIGMQIASPVFITLFITSISLAFVSKVVPQLNIFAVSFQLKIIAGLLMLAIIVPIILLFFREMFIRFERIIFQLIESLMVI